MKRKGRGKMEKKDMENLKAKEMEKAAGGELPTFPVPEKYKLTCPKCGSQDITHEGIIFHCKRCGHNWRPIIGRP